MAIYTNIAVATPAVTNRFVTTTNMKVGAYTVANASPAMAGAVHVTVTHTAVTGTDTLGTIVVAGTNLTGGVISETITPLDGTVATGTKWFRTVTSVTGAGWVINTGNDTLVVGYQAGVVVADGGGTLVSVVVNTTAAGTVILADAKGTIATLKSSIGEGTYPFLVDYAGYLRVTTGAASDITVVHTASFPTYATA